METALTATESDVGFVCGQCDTFAPLGSVKCPTCSTELGFAKRTVQPASAPAKAPSGAGLAAVTAKGPPSRPSPAAGTVAAGAVSASGLPPVVLHQTTPPTPTPVVGPVQLPIGFVLTEALMEQARSYVCNQCRTPVPPGHKFCGRCGASVPREVLAATTLVMSKMLEPGRAKLVVIKGEGLSTDPAEETVFLLARKQHVAGRSQGVMVFEKDNWVSPKHADFYYRDDGKLVVKDEGSLNGVFLRLRAPVELQNGDIFLAGEQAFRVEEPPKPADQPEADGTYFYSSPKRPAPFRVGQVLRGGHTGMLIGARENVVTIGRDNCEMNFPNDPYMSGRHCKVDVGANGKLTLTDMGSKNGTYIRIRGERELSNGDFVFIGRELLRVDITA